PPHLSALSLHDALPISFGSSPNSNIQILEVTPPPGSRGGKRFAANNHASDRAFSAPLFPSARSMRDQLALPESSQFERSFPMVPDRKSTRLNSSHVSIS